MIYRGHVALVGHFPRLLDLLLCEATPHEQAIKLATILYIILDLRDCYLGLVTRFGSTLTKHVNDCLDNPLAVLMVTYPWADPLDQEAVRERHLLPEATTFAISHLDATEHLRLAAGVAHHHECLLGLL